MKKLIYISVVICLNIIVFGGLLKIMHLPFANILLAFGMLTLALFVFPAAFINSYKAEKTSKTLYIVGFICAFVFIIGALFKILHWPGAGVLLVISIPLPIILFLPVFYNYQKKMKVENHSNLIGVMFLLTYYSLFSAILSINVSKNIINSFVLSVNQIENTKQAFDAYNITENQNIDTLKNAKLSIIKSKTDELTSYIHNLKTELISEIEGVKNEVADTISPYLFTKKDNYDIPTSILLGKDGKANLLKQKIEKTKSELVQILDNENTKEQINKLLDTSDKINSSSNQLETWEMNEFYNTIFIATIYKLTNLELDVKIAEMEAIQSIN